MTERSLIFPRAEYEARTAALQERMGEDGFAALLLTSPADVFHVTGFLTRFWESPARPWFVIVPADGPPVAVIPSIGADLMARTWVADIRTWDAPDPVDDGVSLLADTLRDCVPEGGRITLTLEPGPVLRVADDGPGIPPAQAERIFERFFRGNGIQSGPTGSGLGLALARAIAERHGLTIALEPTDKGANFRVGRGSA